MPKKTNRFRIPIIFGLFLCFVWGAAALLHRSLSEQQLITEARDSLQQLGIENVAVSFKGTLGMLSGEVTSAALKEKAVYIVAEVQGVTAVNAEKLLVKESAATAN